MTAEEFDAIMFKYFEPLYMIIGAAVAVAVIGAAFMLVVWPFLKRLA